MTTWLADAPVSHVTPIVKLVVSRVTPMVKLVKLSLKDQKLTEEWKLLQTESEL